MHRTGIWILTIFLVACGGRGYNASGTWQGTAANQSYPYDSLAMRFYFNDQSGTYRIVAYGSGSLTASLSLARGGTQSLNLPLEVGVLTRLLEEL